MNALPLDQTGMPAAPAPLDEQDVIHFALSVRNPVSIVRMPLLARILRLGFQWRRGLSKRLIGKPCKTLFRRLSKSNAPAQGWLRIQTGAGPRDVSFDARNSQFSSLYFPQYQPFYEADLCEIFSRIVGPRDVFFDIGANWGWHSIVLAARPNFQGAIHAFEPFPSSYADLKATINQAGLESRVIGHNLALGERDGEANMAFPDGMLSGGAQLAKQGVKVRLARLDSLDLPLPKLIKIDVEGYEMGVLRGAANLIQKARPFIVFESLLFRDRPDVTLAPLNFLADANYALFYPGWAPKHPDFSLPNYAGTGDLSLTPCLPAHRSRLGDLVNVVAAPQERLDEFRASFR